MSEIEGDQISTASHPGDKLGDDTKAASDVYSSESLADSASKWVDSSVQRFSSTIDLIAAEAKLAALSITMILAISIFLALTVFVAWGSAVALVMSLLIQNGVTFTMASLSMLITHIILAVLSLLAINRVGHSLSFRATRRQLKSKSQESYELASTKA